MTTVRTQWGMVCPRCGKDDRLEIAVTMWAALDADGTTEDAEDVSHDWYGGSGCRCAACNWVGLVIDAEDAAQIAPTACPDDGNLLADDGVCGFCGNAPAVSLDGGKAGS